MTNAENNTNHIFETKRISRLFFTLAVPGLISMLAMSAFSVIEGVFVGHYLGEAALAAVSLAMPFVFINFSLSDLIGVGSSVHISIALGRKDKARANTIFSCSLIMIFLCSLVMGVILFTMSPLFVRALGSDGKTAELAVEYVRVYAMMGPVTTLMFAVDNYLRICGYVRFSMTVNVIFTVLTGVFIFLFLGVAGMSLGGSSLATCLAMTTCVIIAFVPFLAKKTLLKFTKPKFSCAMVRDIVTSGLPVFFANISGRVAAITMNVMLLRLGGDTAVAAYAVLMYSNEIIQPMMYGMCDSVQPAIGYNWGAGKVNRVSALAKCSFIACAVVSAVGMTLMLSVPKLICSIFVAKDNPALLQLAVHAMRLFAFCYAVRWFGFTAQGFYSAIEKPLPASVLSIASAMVFPIIFIFALSPLGLNGLWVNLGATSLVVSIMAYFMLRKTQKGIKNLMTS